MTQHFLFITHNTVQACTVYLYNVEQYRFALLHIVSTLISLLEKLHTVMIIFLCIYKWKASGREKSACELS